MTQGINEHIGAGGRQASGYDGFGCRILVLLEGAGFGLPFSVFLTNPVTLSAQNRSSTAGGSYQPSVISNQ
jgi:hypothetical protein